MTIKSAADLDRYITSYRSDRYVWRSMGDSLVLVDLVERTWTTSRAKIIAHLKRETKAEAVRDFADWYASTCVAAQLDPYRGLRGTPMYDCGSGQWTLAPDRSAKGPLLYADWRDRWNQFRRDPPSPRECIDQLIGKVSDEQWTDEVAPLVWVADVLTCLVRPSLGECTPLTVYRSEPVVGIGSGKSTLAHAAAAIGCGTWADVPAAGTDVLLRDISIKMQREPAIVLDNESSRRLEGGPVSDGLAAACTAGGNGRLVSSRKHSDACVTTPLLASWSATTNGGPLHVDWSRRSLECRVEPRRGRPWSRPRDVVADVLAAPSTTLMAMHVLDSWVTSGGPNSTSVTILPSFHAWSRWIAGAVLKSTGIDIVRAAVPSMRRGELDLLREAFGVGGAFRLPQARAVLHSLEGVSDHAAGRRVTALVGAGRRSTGGRTVWTVT